MIWIISVFVLIVLCYTFIIFKYAFYYCKHKNTSKVLPCHNKLPFFSIIVPFRNEECNIDKLIYSIINQNYPIHSYEVIFVDDHSEDNTNEKILKWEFSNFRIFKLSDTNFGKKAAIRKGIEVAKSNLIVTIDADCRAQTSWLAGFASTYTMHKCSFIIAPVLFENENKTIEKLFSLEQLSIVAATEAAVYANSPIMCSGANLFFNKKIFLTPTFFLVDKHPSGDDMFLLEYVKKHTSDKIGFFFENSAMVYTNTPKSIKEFINQRIRWISKGKYYNDKIIIMVAVVVAMTNILISVIFILSFFKTKFLWLYLFFIVLKSLADLSLISQAAQKYNKMYLLKWFPIAQFIYPFYVTYLVIVSNLLKFEWKNRVYK